MALPQALAELEGKYEILHKIKEGGMGAIYKVRHRLLDEVRVIKVIKPEHGDDPKLRERFIREARMAIKLRHPNIAQLHDFSLNEEGVGFMVMEFIDGMTLHEILTTQGPPPLDLGLEIGIQGLKSIEILHRQGLIHRDVSPDNLMITQGLDGRPLVKLIDLGIAKSLEGVTELTDTGVFMGKVRYGAPECFELGSGSSDVDSRSDLYSYGIVLYELLTGKYPISGDDFASLVYGHCLGEPLGFDESDPEGGVPKALRDIVVRAMAKRAGDRPQSAEQMGDQLRQIQRDLASTASQAETLTAILANKTEIEVG